MRDLRIAVGICRLMPFVSRVRKPWIIPFFIYTSAILAAFVPSRLRSRKVRESRETGIQRALRKRIEAFLTYCGNYLQEPTFSIIPPELPGGKKPIPKTPRGRFHDAIEMTGELISWGIDEYRAWSMPIGQARVCRILYRKSIGMDVDIDEPEEEQFRNEMKAFLEAQKNQQKK